MSNQALRGSTPAPDRKAAIEALEKQLRTTPRASRPYEYATVAYRLGLAYAESPLGSPEEGLRRALAHFDEAAAIFDPRYDPVEHARILNAAGAAHRGLGNRQKAAELFARAAELFEGKDRDGERAAALNNLGLVRTELGQLDSAVEAFDAATDLFDTTEADGRRGRVATLHNRGQAHAAAGTEEGLEAALADYEEARADLDPDDAPYHYGLVHHSIGITCTALANLREEDRREFLQEAVRAFSESLEIFTRTAFPYQYALAMHNLGLAYAALGGTTNLRRALASFEEGVAILDPRVHAEAWRQAYASLERTEKQLADVDPGRSRPDHFANLAADLRRDDREALVRSRLTRFFALPEHGKVQLAELALATARLGEKRGRGVYEAILVTIMETHRDTQEAAIDAIWEAHRQLGGEQREQADAELDQAISDALGGPQRIFVRDHLYAAGWERP
ncbi:MAG: tetratricopeptide repeat protein [Acidimicrobiales bacterium]